MAFLITAIAVSLDAYFAGIALSDKKSNIRAKISLSVGFYTMLLCLLALYFATYLSRFALGFKILGFIIFVLLGVKNLINSIKSNNINTATNTTLAGIGVSLDASVACLSISVSGWLIILCACVMAIFHAFFVLLGMMTGRFAIFAKKLTVISGVLLIVLGVMKLF